MTGPRALLAAGLTLAVFAGGPAADAQRAAKPARLCFLTFDPGTARSPSVRFEAFFQGLRELGHVEGQTLALDYLSADGRPERFPALAGECVRLRADVIVVTTTPAARAAKGATSSIPIVMLHLGDPVGTGLVDSLARPGANVTGTSAMTSGLAAKRLELLKEAVPGLSRVLVLAHLADPIAPLQVQALKAAAPALGVTLLVHDIRAAEDLPAAFQAAGRERADGLITTAESIFVVERVRVTELAARHRLPAIYVDPRVVIEHGGLMAYAIHGPELQRRTAAYVDRLVKGAKPSELAVEQPTKFWLAINMKAAAALGLTIPPVLLARADQVVE